MKKTTGTIKKMKSTNPKGALVLIGMFAFTLLLIVGLSALVLKLLAPEPTVDPEIVEHAAASTMKVSVPIYVDETLNALLPGAISGTLTAIAPTATTPTSTSTQPVIPCGQAGFVSDGTIVEGTSLQPSAAFTKVWIIRNTSTCTWAEDFSLVFFDGELMAGKSPVTLGRQLNPGDSIEISVNLVAPATGGVYTSRWKLKNSTGDVFGVTPDNQPLSLHIVVGPHEVRALDFTEAYNLATWNIAAGDPMYPSPEGIVPGSVQPVTTTVGEMGIVFDLPSLEMIPNEGPQGNIIGTYNLMQIQNKDSFSAIIACADNQPECNLLFELMYDPGDHQPVSLGQWVEVTDGAHQKVSVDLSPLAGQDIQLILKITPQNGTAFNNKGLWISPVIFRTVN